MTADYPTAIQRYQPLLREEPERVLALNNLTLALAEQTNQSQQAEATLDRALELKPNVPGLLDSWAMLALYRSEPDRALEVLKQLVLEEPADSVVRLHLAVAYRDMEDGTAAKESFLDALGHGLGNQLLSPADRQVVREMRGTWSL